MDPLFVGLIFSVYHSDSGSKTNQIQLICFQSGKNLKQELEHKEIELVINKAPLHDYNMAGT